MLLAHVDVIVHTITWLHHELQGVRLSVIALIRNNSRVSSGTEERRSRGHLNTTPKGGDSHEHTHIPFGMASKEVIKIKLESSATSDDDVEQKYREEVGNY